MKGNKHSKHSKKRLYARDQNTISRQWQRTDIYLCECGAILEEKLDEVKL